MCVTGVATISDNGNAVGFEDTSVKGTSGGADIDDGAAVTDPVAAAEFVAEGAAAPESVAWRGMLAANASSGSGAENRALRSML